MLIPNSPTAVLGVSTLDPLQSLADILSAALAQWHAEWSKLIAWLSQPPVYTVLITWAITFTLVITILMLLGFGRAGVVAGSLAAVWQSCMYGAFTPAGGIFATLTSIGMLGWLMPAAVLAAALVATIVTAVVWSVQH